MKTQAPELRDTDFLFLKIKNLWTYFKGESLAFKSICAYLFIEYFRPQEIFPVIDFLPWAQLFLLFSFIGVFFDSKARVRFSCMHFLLVLFAIALHLSIVSAYYPEWSYRYYIAFAQWVVIIFLITSIVNTKERFYVFFTVFFLCSLKIAIGTAKSFALRGFAFTGWGLKGPSGYFENSGELAVLMLILFPISFYIFLNLKKYIGKWERYILIVAMVAPILTILGSSSRGAQIALVIQLVAMFWKKVFKFKVMIPIVLVGFLGWQVLPAEQKARFTDIGEDKSSIQRQLYWENGWEMMKDNPLLGVGYFNFRPYYEKFYPEDVLYTYAQLPHNILIQVGTDTGFIGLFFYILIIAFSMMRRVYIPPNLDESSQAYLKAAWVSIKIGILGFFIAGQFVTIGYYPFLWISLALQQSLAFSINEARRRREQNEVKSI